MRKILVALIAVNGICYANAQDSSKTNKSNSSLNPYRWCIDLNIKSAILSQNLTMRPDLAGQYANVVSSAIGATKFTDGKANGFDVQLGRFFGQKQHFGIGSGILYLSQKGNLILDKFNIEYQANDSKNAAYTQSISATSAITEAITVTNVNVPLVLKYKTCFGRNFGFTVDAGIVYNIKFRNAYSTNAVFNYDSIYEHSTTYVHNVSPAINTGSVAYAKGSIGWIFQPAVSYRLSDQLFLNVGVHYQYQDVSNNQGTAYRLTDKPGGYNSILNSVTGSGNNSYGVNIGLRFLFGKNKDSDHDGIPNKRDRCPFDSGLVQFKGCPDSDHDGVPDIDDLCPRVAGLVQFQGCPDTDGDGIPDKDDACPYDFGLARFNGCPDSDEDGIPDQNDSCPHQAGTAAFNGCPDSDGDGIPDNLDLCPFVAGPAENHGCPDKQPPAEDPLDAVARSPLQFEPDRFTIKKSSYPYLDSIVMVLNDYPEANIMIDGFCDTTGTKAVNKVISGKRAEQVQKYFVKHGIDPTRTIAKGHGSSEPIADNTTSVGRAKNRRATMMVKNDGSVISLFSDKEPGSFTISLTTKLKEQAKVTIMNSKNAIVKEFNVEANKPVDFTLDQPAGLYSISASTPTILFSAKVLIIK